MAAACMICTLIGYRLSSGSLPWPASFTLSQYLERAHAYDLQLKSILLWMTPFSILLTVFLLTFRRIKRIVATLIRIGESIPGSFFWLVIPILFTIAAAWTAEAIIGGVPRVFDGFNYHFQARNLALGQFYAPMPPLADMFRFPFIILEGGKWYGSVYPGYPLLLSIGIRLSADWLINPVLGGIALMLLYFACREMLGERSARVASVLTLLSPFARMMSSIFMAHAAAVMWVTLAMWMAWRWFKRGRGATLLEPGIAGCAIGWIYITRPQAGVVALAPMFLFVLWKARLGGWKRVTALVVPLICFVIFLGIYNHQLTGDFRVNPRYHVDPERRLGFGEDLGEPLPGGGRSGHDFARGIRNVRLLTGLWNAEMFGWGSWGPIGWMSVMILLALGGNRKQPLQWTLFLSVVFNLVLYVFYYTPSPNFGPRYLAEIIPASVILFISGLHVAARRLPGSWRYGDRPVGLAILMTVLSVVSICVMVPLHTDHYGLLPPVLSKESIPGTQKPSVILIPENLYCMNIYTWNSPNLNGNIYLPVKAPESDTGSGGGQGNRRGDFVTADDSGLLIHEILAAFPGRDIFRLERSGGDDDAIGMVRLHPVHGQRE